MTNAKSHNAAVLLNDIFARLRWYGWNANATADAATVRVQYKSDSTGEWREVEVDSLRFANFIKLHPSRHEVAKICDKKSRCTQSPRSGRTPLSRRSHHACQAFHAPDGLTQTHNTKHTTP